MLYVSPSDCSFLNLFLQGRLTNTSHLAGVQALTGARPSWALLYFNFFKRYKGSQDTRHTNYYFANFSNFSCVEGVFLFSSPFLSSSVRHLSLNRQKNDTKITNRHRVVSRAPCLDECFSISFSLSILKGIKTYFINILQYLM